MGDARDDKDNDGQHAEHKEGKSRADVEKHGQIEHHADNGGDHELDGVEGALLILDNVASETREYVALAASAIIGKGQAHGLGEKLVAKVTHHLGAEHSHLDQREVAENVLAGVESKDYQSKENQRLLGAEGDEPVVELLYGLREERASGRRDRSGYTLLREKNLDKVGHGEGCGHGEDHRQHYKETVCGHTGSIRFQIV